jgi:hypothetical protein
LSIEMIRCGDLKIMIGCRLKYVGAAYKYAGW